MLQRKGLNMKKVKFLAIIWMLAITLFIAACQDDKDKEAPVISGVENITYIIGETQPDFLDGITAIDNVDETLEITVDSSAVSYTVPGTYNVIISVTDQAGNVATETLILTVEFEGVDPVISGTQNYTIEQGDEVPDYLDGVVAVDNVDGTLTDSIEVDDSDVNYDTIGTYDVVFSVSDTAGNEVNVTVQVTVVKETTEPVISGHANIEISPSATNVNFLENVTALDNFDGDLTDQIEVDTSLLDVETLGTYSIFYSVTDAAGNETVVEVTVHVKDMTAPIITGHRNLTFEVNSTPNFLWKDIRATDDIDGDLLDQIIIDDSEVDLSVIGTYPLTYRVEDSAGNMAEVTVNITIADRTKPVISALSQTIYYLEDDELPDFLSNATAMDNYDGDISENLTVDTDDINYDVEGSYDVIYTVSDNQGNTQTLTIQLVVPNPADVEKVLYDYEELVFTMDPITSSSLALPTSGTQGATITWKSLTPRIISNTGKIVRSQVGGSPIEVELLATLKYGTYAAEKVIQLIIAPIAETVISNKVNLIYEALGTDYVTTDGAIDTYYAGNIPYVDIEDFLNLIDGAIESEILNYTYNEDIMIISYTIEYEDIFGEITEEIMTATLNFTDNTFTVDTLSFFDYYVAQTTTNYGDGLEYVNADYIDPSTVVFPLGDYGFDMVIHQDGESTKYLLPFHVADLLFLGNQYFDVYYNGDQFYGLDTGQLYDSVSAEVAEIRASSMNTSLMTLDVKMSAFNYLAFAMDFYYGIKKFAGVETYYDLLVPYMNNMVFGNDDQFYRAIFEFVYGLDDLHTSHVFTGYYEPTTYGFTLSLADLGSRTQSYYNRMWSIQDQYEARFGTTIPMLRITEDGKTAIIYIDGFEVKTPDLFKETLDTLPDTVENVVVDLANNGGGNLGAVLRIFGYMVEEDIVYHSQNPGDGSAVTYYIQSEYEAYPYNWFIMTSSVTFSAANLMASMAKELGIPIIGQNASGGASSIGIILPPGGSSLLISTNNVLSARIFDDEGNPVYLSIEYGVTVDYRVTSITNDEEVSQLVNQIVEDRNEE
jgi:hypothetical protein